MDSKREMDRQTFVRSKERQRPVQKVRPMQAQQQIPQQEIKEMSGRSEQASVHTAKAIIMLQNGEIRLTTFKLRGGGCTLHQLLGKLNIPSWPDSYIQCMRNHLGPIDYVITIGLTTNVEDIWRYDSSLSAFRVSDGNSESDIINLCQSLESAISTSEKS